MSPDFERLVGRALLDPDFRKQLLDDPDGTVKSGGFSITEAEMDQIRKAAQDPAAAQQQMDSLGVASSWS